MNKSIKKSLKILENAKDTTFQDEIDDFLANARKFQKKMKILEGMQKDQNIKDLKESHSKLSKYQQPVKEYGEELIRKLSTKGR